MKYLWTGIAFFILLVFCCCNQDGAALGEKNFHEQYARKLRKAGLEKTALGKAWFSEAEKALAQPVKVSLPYRMIGYFSADKPSAIGLGFTATRGEKLLFRLTKKPDTSFVIYTDVWQQQNNTDRKLLISADTSMPEFDVEVKESGDYFLRLQPELLGSGEYELSISIGPSLAFPSSSGSVQSFWGADRDGGSRSHEGIDIFAPRRTPVVAAADGRITRVGENQLGGKVIFMRVGEGRNISLYYAHLDSQLVEAGQQVKQGDTIGLMGNTGNARTTAPHLHFGIYTIGGAIDPLPFVNPKIKRPQNFTFSTSLLMGVVRLTTGQKVLEKLFLKGNQAILPLAVGTNGLIGELPTGPRLLVPVSAITAASNQINKRSLEHNSNLLDAPFVAAAIKKRLVPNESVAVLAFHENYALVKVGDDTGWMPASLL